LLESFPVDDGISKSRRLVKGIRETHTGFKPVTRDLTKIWFLAGLGCSMLSTKA